MTPNELPNPRSRVEDYLAVLVERTGATIPEGVPHSRVEAYLRYICEEGVSGLKNGYYYEGAFYKDAEHTELIEPKEGRAYLDVANLAIYIYQDGAYNDYLTDVKTAIGDLSELKTEDKENLVKAINYIFEQKESGLPPVTRDDDGKILKVQGEKWAVITPYYEVTNQKGTTVSIIA